MNNDTHEMLSRLERSGISSCDALALRRVSMTLHNWHELECGNERGGIERDEATNKPYWINANNGKRSVTADRETGALKRLNSIMARYPDKKSYVQGDPRGAALYILHPGNVPEGESADAYYSRGTAVYK